MCGIVYSKSFIGRPVHKTVMKRYVAQRSRGTDGFGFYVPEKNKLVHNTREGRILTLLRRHKKASEILFHHRLPTSTLNVRNSCHPFSTKDVFKHNYIVVHNGIVYNDAELKKEHEALGIKYVSEMPDGSFNDSEALAYDIGRFLEGQTQQMTSKGSVAFIAIKRSKKGVPLAVYFYRNFGSPLRAKITNWSLTVSSEGEGELLEVNKLFCFDYKTQGMTKRNLDIPEYSRTYYGANYYEGFGFGYSPRWQRRSHSVIDEEEDDELFELGYTPPTNSETARYFDQEFEWRERGKIKAIKDRLMYEANENPFDALEDGESELSTLQRREKELEQLVEFEEAGTEEESDEYMEIPDKIYYLKGAISELEKECQSATKQGFFLTGEIRRQLNTTMD